MSIGTLFAERFLIEAVAGVGGMGTVYRARDIQSGKTVALKVLQGVMAEDSATMLQRFAREARLLSELRHPNIVGYLADGQTADGQHYLAMEWLEGEDLGRRLSAGPLPLRDCFTVLRIAASALDAAHRIGVVHRDIKPTNLFLRNGSVDGLTLLDFGIARDDASGRQLTRTGATIGTPRYMAPEQARGQKDIKQSADIFSLGSVLFECLVGSPPFMGQHEGAVLAKILFEDPPPVRNHRPAVPPELEAILQQMLAKDPEQRPRDAGALLAALEKVPIPAENDTPASGSLLGGSRGIVDSEKRPFTVIVATPRDKTLLQRPPSRPHSSSVETDVYEPQVTLLRSISSFGAQVELLADGSLVGQFATGDNAHDQVRQAARCALLMREQWPDARVAIASGSCVVEDRQAVGLVLDRAMNMTNISVEAVAAAPTPQDGSLEGVILDPLSAGLLDNHFSMTRQGTSIVLLAERDSIDESRLLLGKPTPCVGRDRELTTLLTTLSRSIEEPQCESVLVTAAPGLGKSRLRHEFLRRLKARGDDIQISVGSGDPMSVGSPYGILSQMLRRRCGIQSGEKPEVQQKKLRERLSPSLPAQDGRIIEFLGELCSIHFPDENSVKLRAARSDPQVMSEQVRQAFVDWLQAECSRQPQLLILEDLHWGDILSVKLIDAALRGLTEQPLMVLALARPEVEDLFPKLWSGRGLKRIHLSELNPKACERLIRQILGAEVPANVIERFVAQAAGNALYLEELIRAFAEGEGKTLPDTVLAMLQARLMRMDAGVRRVLRAASVFGETFWRDGVMALLGQGSSQQDLDLALQALIDTESIEKHRESRFPGQEEYGFRHGLMRDAAYATLTGQDRVRAHQLAVLYLEQVGEQDPMVLAEHAQRGEDMERAVRYYVSAAKLADAGYDSDGALVRAERGIACGAQGEELGTLSEIQCYAHYCRGTIQLGIAPGYEALRLLRPGSLGWCRSIGTMFTLLGLSGQLPALNELVGRFTSTDPDEEAKSQYVTACSTLICMFSSLAFRDATSEIGKRMNEIAGPILDHEPVARGWYQFGTAVWLGHLEPENWKRHEVAQDSVRAFEQSGSARFISWAQNVAGSSLAGLGRWEEAEQTLSESLALAARLQESNVTALARVSFVCFMSRHPELRVQEEAMKKAEEQLAQTSPAMVHTTMAKRGMARILLQRGQYQEAEKLGRELVDLLMMIPAMRPPAYAILAQALLEQGRSSEARQVAEEGMQFIQFLGGYSEESLDVRLALAESCHAEGDVASAHRALREAVDELQLRADKIPEPASRDSFMNRISANVRVQALARAWLDAPSA